MISHLSTLIHLYQTIVQSETPSSTAEVPQLPQKHLQSDFQTKAAQILTFY